jgi:bacteriophage N4 adsorption protein A
VKRTIVSAALALVLVVPTLLFAGQDPSGRQLFDVATDISSRERFVLYPHLQKAWDAMQQGRRDVAVAELEHARSLAPDNATVALLLAQAYRSFRDYTRAESILRQQLTRTPHDARLTTAVTQLQAAATKAPAPLPPVNACAGRMDGPCQPQTPLSSHAAGAVATAAPAARHTAAAARPLAVPPAPAALGRADTAVLHEPMDPAARFDHALQARRLGEAQREAELALAQAGNGPALLDELTFRLMEAGASEQAARVLMHMYPFAAGAPSQRDDLLQRLVMLVEARRSVLTAEDLLPLREPLDTPALRSRQAAFWEIMQDCAAVRAVLKDRSSEYGYDDWLRLGDCSTADLGSALHAYARAHALEPGGRASRALAYRAYEAADYATALDAWRSVGRDGLSRDELLAAATTGVAAGANDQALNWLRAYRERGDAPEHRYWSLLAESVKNTDTAAAAAALEHAIALHPDADYYVRLARLQTDAERQVDSLKQAAALDPANAAVQLELAYACSRAGRPASALVALQRAAALDPQNMNAQIELGFAYWRSGRVAEAEAVFESASRADPGNQAVARQLVYIYQRLGQNKQARAYAERVLDAPSLSNASVNAAETDALMNQRFGFQRLHEDLDRRLTLSLDGFSGSHVGTAANGPQAGSGYRSYSQFEADVRLGGSPVRNGSTLSAFTRVVADGGDLRSAVPAQNALLGVGVRYKPWGSQVIYFAAEDQTALEDRSRHDVMLRASASFFNGGRFGDDWHPSGGGWMARNLYIDAARYLEGKYSAATIDYRTSYHQKVAANQTVEPFAHLQLSAIARTNIDRDVRSGLGLRWNVWSGANRYDAPPHKLSLGVEFQQAFQTYLIDRNGFFVTFGTRW